MSFAEVLRQTAVDRRITLPSAAHPEPLAHLSYEDERALKQEALRRFWREHGLPSEPEAIVPAPEPRGYRTTTKRRAFRESGRLRLAFPGLRSGSPAVAPSDLDPPRHLEVYRHLSNALAKPSARALAESLNFAVVRGREPRCVILNVTVFDARVVRGAKQVAEGLAEAGLGVQAAFLYLDPSASDYYLEARRPAKVLSWKRLFGPDWLSVRAADRTLRFPPTVFSQVNEAMLPAMLEAVGQMAGSLEGRSLLDLYCGYGLFALTVGRAASAVVGVDYDGPAVEAAARNAAHFPDAERVRFVAGNIDATLVRGLRAFRGPEVVLLDPPRQGTAEGVVAALAARRPGCVVHVCCGTDEMPREIEAWGAAGYRLARAVPLDLFAGTANLETVLGLTVK